MSDESMNKFLCERVEKRKWLEIDWWNDNPNYLRSGDDYLRLMQAAKKEEWWADFAYTEYHFRSVYDIGFVDRILFDPSLGAPALAEYLGYKEDGNG